MYESTLLNIMYSYLLLPVCNEPVICNHGPLLFWWGLQTFQFFLSTTLVGRVLANGLTVALLRSGWKMPSLSQVIPVSWPCGASFEEKKHGTLMSVAPLCLPSLSHNIANPTVPVSIAWIFLLVVRKPKVSTLQSLYNATRYNTVLVITRPGLGSQMVIFQ